MTPSTHTRALVVLACAVSPTAWGCGAARAPVATRPAPSRVESAATPLTLDAHEARPDALVFVLGAPGDDASEGGVVEVFRSVGDEQFVLHQHIELDGRRADALGAARLYALDRDVAPGGRYTYVARLRGDESASPLHTSAPLRWECQAPLPAPAARAREGAAGVIEVTWESPERRLGALVLRRDLLSPKSPAKRVATLGPGARGIYLDRDVAPGGVYAYRIALTRDEDVMTLGRLSEEIFVSLDTSR